jgi:EAL domain-containing protein (putative c-di-GMP-specific phosphodiesterase class I)
VKSYGCKIAIDDFGTGYSNFTHLLKLQTDYIKIDGSIIKNIDTNLGSRALVKTIVNFAKEMGIKTIAEYVEDEKIFTIVKELGVDYTQGYFFSQAVVAPDFSR